MNVSNNVTTLQAPSPSHISQAVNTNSSNSDADSLRAHIMLSNEPVIKHIPKSARSACASHLSDLLNNVVAKPQDLVNWISFLRWSQQILHPPKRAGKKHNLTSAIKKRISAFTPDASLVQSEKDNDVTARRSLQRDRETSLLSDAIAAKMGISEPLLDCFALTKSRRRFHRKHWTNYSLSTRQLHSIGNQQQTPHPLQG